MNTQFPAITHAIPSLARSAWVRLTAFCVALVAAFGVLAGSTGQARPFNPAVENADTMDALIRQLPVVYGMSNKERVMSMIEGVPLVILAIALVALSLVIGLAVVYRRCRDNYRRWRYGVIVVLICSSLFVLVRLFLCQQTWWRSIQIDYVNQDSCERVEFLQGISTTCGSVRLPSGLGINIRRINRQDQTSVRLSQNKTVGGNVPFLCPFWFFSSGNKPGQNPSGRAKALPGDGLVEVAFGRPDVLPSAKTFLFFRATDTDEWRWAFLTEQSRQIYRADLRTEPIQSIHNKASKASLFRLLNVARICNGLATAFIVEVAPTKGAERVPARIAWRLRVTPLKARRVLPRSHIVQFYEAQKLEDTSDGTVLSWTFKPYQRPNFADLDLIFDLDSPSEKQKLKCTKLIIEYRINEDDWRPLGEKNYKPTSLMTREEVVSEINAFKTKGAADYSFETFLQDTKMGTVPVELPMVFQVRLKQSGDGPQFVLKKISLRCKLLVHDND